jgi:hypothetical protein
MRLFGFEIKRKAEDEIESFAEPINDDGALTVGTALGGSYSMLLDLEGTARTEAELVTRYRQMALNSEIQVAVDEIVNEVVSIDSHDNVVEIVLDDLKVPDKLKFRIKEEFEEILNLLDFSNNAYEIINKFYVDGRLNYHVIIDEKNLKRGIVELRYLDPRKIRLIREMEDQRMDAATGATFKKIKNEYYMYSDGGFGSASFGIGSNRNQNVSGFKIAKDSIVRVTSGVLNETNTVILSHLHKVIKPLNQLRMLEDATVIYTMTRAPERRVFYIDVGNLPKAKAEQYLHDMMTRHKNKLSYDATTGELKDERKMMTMTEDFWFPRREGNRSTEIDVLGGGSGLMENENLTYFQTKLYKALNVPVTRLQPETMYSFGRVSEISRDELKFSKFIRRLRARFSIIFDKCLEKQLILKGVISPDEWSEIKNKIRYDFMKDNYFEELKETEILKERLSTLREIDDHIGKYFSREWVVKNVLYMSDTDMKENQKQIEKERKAGVYRDALDADEEPKDDSETDDVEVEPIAQDEKIQQL